MTAMTRRDGGALDEKTPAENGFFLQDVSRLLGVTPRHVQRWVADGTLSATKDDRGRLVFDPAELCRLALQRANDRQVGPAATARRAFELFEEGATLGELVGVLNITPKEIRALFEEWRTPLGKNVRDVARDEERAREEEDEVRERDERDMSAALERARSRREALERELDDQRGTRKRRT